MWQKKERGREVEFLKRENDQVTVEESRNSNTDEFEARLDRRGQGTGEGDSKGKEAVIVVRQQSKGCNGQ